MRNGPTWDGLAAMATTSNASFPVASVPFSWYTGDMKTTNTTRPSPSRLGQMIQSLRDARRLSQRDLALMSGVSRRTIEAIEQGCQQDLPWTSVQRIALALDLSTEELRTLGRDRETGK